MPRELTGELNRLPAGACDSYTDSGAPRMGSDMHQLGLPMKTTTRSTTTLHSTLLSRNEWKLKVIAKPPHCLWVMPTVVWGSPNLICTGPVCNPTICNMCVAGQALLIKLCRKFSCRTEDNAASCFYRGAADSAAECHNHSASVTVRLQVTDTRHQHLMGTADVMPGAALDNKLLSLGCCSLH